jgi:hypothetical protein
MPTPLATAFFVFAAFLLTVSTLAAILVAGAGLLIQIIAFLVVAGMNSEAKQIEQTATVPREFEWGPPGGGV